MSTLRVTAGTLRGRRILVPPRDVRPTSERARQAFFNIIGQRIDGAHFLDLFAGSGIFSFEALSRGAQTATAVDSSRQNIAAIEQVAGTLGVNVKTVAADALSGIKRLGSEVFDVVYADPPYDYVGYDDLLMTIDRNLTLAPGAVVAIEHRRNSRPFTTDLQRLAPARSAGYGEVWITLFKENDDAWN